MKKTTLLMCMLMMLTAVSCSNGEQSSEAEILPSEEYSSSEEITEYETAEDTSLTEPQTSAETETEKATADETEAETSDTENNMKADEAHADEMSDVYDCAYKVIGLMSELSSNESYIELTAGSALSDEYGEIKDSLIISDVTAPRAVYMITGAKEASESVFLFEIGEAFGLSDNVKDNLEKRVLSNIAVTFNQNYGAQKVAMSSILTASQMFVRESITEERLYIFIYDGCFPVTVSFNTGNEGAVSVSAGYIFSDELINCDKETFEAFLDSTVYSGLLGIEQIK